ncbi:DUF6701 domain-containing protein [Shewanella sp. GXUN23E]|uniref:DUF6701 domain-containing protein n=1 Tax=Shewanella sp. GXUN23E TaxID=3422498 RepID=UPI003D7ED11D
MFKDPSLGEAATETIVPPPGVMDPPLVNFTCPRKSTCQFTVGDHDYNQGYFSNGSSLTASGTTARLFFNSLNLTNARLNVGGAAENLFIYVSGDLSVSGQNQINGIIYVAGNVHYSGQASLDGVVAAGGGLKYSGQANLVYSQDTIDKADLSGICGATTTTPELQFGTTAGRSVTFERPFSNGVTPLVFLMPTITPTAPANDGPASLFLTSVSASGFSFSQLQPPGSYSVGASMGDVSWIAATPGTHTLSDGRVLQAGSVSTNKSVSEYQASYETVSLNAGMNLALHQLQSGNNDRCWLTSTGLLGSGSLRLSLDLSDVWNGNGYCLPGYVYPGNFANETIAYLASSSGSGSASLSGRDTQYHFANFNTGSGTQSSSQCSTLSSLNGFSAAPVAVGKKTSRNGTDGGWLRRCNLTASSISMVVDEDQYWDSERNHPQENYSVMAFGDSEDPSVLTCFSDTFSDGVIDDSWDVIVTPGGAPPNLVAGRLRVTEDINNQANALTLQKQFPAADNLVVVEFDYYAWSRYSGNGADGVAVIFSDALVAPSPGSFGGSLGYAQRDNGDAGFAGGWLGIGLDEWGNFANPTEGRVGGPGFRPQAVTIRGSQASSYNYLAGTSANLSPHLDVRSTSTPGPAHRYRVTLDSRIAGNTRVSVERDTHNGSGFVNLVPEFNAQSRTGQGLPPADFLLSLTGSTGGSTNNHELDNLQVCAIRMNDFGVDLDHFEFHYSASPLTCAPEIITLKACADESCSQLVTEPVSALLSVDDPGAARWQSSAVTLNNGTAEVSLQGLSASPLTIGVSSSTPLAAHATLCSRNGAAPSALQCSFSFADSGLLIEVPDKLAGKAVTATVSAVRTSDQSLACAPAFVSTSKPLTFWSQYDSPASPVPAGAPPGVTLQGSVIGRLAAAATPLTVSFDARGQAELTLDYADAGRLILNARYAGSVGEEDEGLVLTGSDSFVSAPAGLCVSPESSCSAADGSCPAFRRAGENFTLSVSGRSWVANDDGELCNNPVTPNYAQNDIQLSAQLVAPLGGVNGLTGLTGYSHTVSASGISQLQQSVSEVGVFRFIATPPADYLGSTAAVADIAAAQSAPVGRFVAADFLLSSQSLAAACGSGTSAFSYLGQPFATGFVATARNLQQQPTRNFVSGTSAATNFANTSVRFTAENNDNGLDLGTRLSGVPSLNWVLGAATVVNHQVSLQRLSPPLVDGPYFATDIGVIIDDADGLAVMANADMDAGSAGGCLGSSCTAVQLGSQQLLFGRLAMDNVYGPESDTLRMPLRAEYWLGSGWAVNQLDSCTAAGAGSGSFNPALLSAVDDVTGHSYTPDLQTGQAVSRQGSGTLAQGRFNLLWQSGGSVPYRGAVQAPLTTPEWLRYYWNWDGSGPQVNDHPRASAYFGTYRGHDKRLHWREQ